MFLVLALLSLVSETPVHADYLPQGSAVVISKTIGLDSKGSPLTIGQAHSTQCKMHFHRRARWASIPSGTQLPIKKSTFSSKKHYDSGVLCEPVGDTHMCREGQPLYYTLGKLELVFDHNLVKKITCHVYRNGLADLTVDDQQIQEYLSFAGLVSITRP